MSRPQVWGHDQNAKHALWHKYTNITTKIKYTKVFWVWIGFAETDTQAWNSPARTFLLLLGRLKILMSENITQAKMGFLISRKLRWWLRDVKLRQHKTGSGRMTLIRGTEVLSSKVLTGCLEKASLPWRSASPECSLGSTPERPRKSGENVFLLSEWSIQSAGQKEKKGWIDKIFSRGLVIRRSAGLGTWKSTRRMTRRSASPGTGRSTGSMTTGRQNSRSGCPGWWRPAGRVTQRPRWRVTWKSRWCMTCKSRDTEVQNH